jgi:nicotinamide-nucleotide amidase
MKSAIFAVGDELTCGYRLDTNSQFIARHLTALPTEVVLHLSAGDDMAAIQQALRVALDVADALVITGGLGPTEDDLTRQAVAAYFGLELVEDAEALARIQERFSRRRLPLPESNRIQALVPAGSTVIQNDRGTAAGFYLAVEGKHVFVVPGVPYEMEGMLEGFILPRLRQVVGTGRHVQRAALKIYGLPESAINERIKPLLARGRNPLLGLLPVRGTITVEVVATGGTPEETAALIEADLVALRALLGEYIVSEDERGLPQVVADLLVERGLTIATVELGTAGYVAVRMTEPAGSERWFRGGSVPGIAPAGEGETPARALAAQAAALADVGVGVGPLIVPEDNTPARPYGLLYAAVNLRGQETARQFRFNGDRLVVREWAADAVLNLVRLCVLEQQ